MSPRYRVKNKDASEYDSGYESEGGSEYSFVRPLGKGEYAKARLFQSSSAKAVCVLSSIKDPADIEEAVNKHRFFKKLYPNQPSDLFRLESDYRLVVPYIAHVSYKKLTVDTLESQKTLFLSASKAVGDCHDKELIILDLKSDNLNYDSRTNLSYLIDGGLSAPTGTMIDPCAFQLPDLESIKEYRKEFPHIPPECWSVYPTAVLATPQMDVYCLGVVMLDLIKQPLSEINALIDSCLKSDPAQRPTLVELITALESMHFGESVELNLSTLRI